MKEERIEIAFGEIVRRCQYGTSSPATDDGETPTVGMKDMQAGRIMIDDLARTSLSNSERQTILLERGDILLNRTNSPALVGKTSIWLHDFEATFASYIVRFQLDLDRAYPPYINYVLNTADSQSRIRQLSTRGVSQANINPTVFQKHFRLHVPSIQEQVWIADVLSDWDAGADLLRSIITSKRRLRDQLASSVFSPAFGSAQVGWRMARLGTLFDERDEKGLDLPLAAITASGGIVDRALIERRDTSADDKSAYKVIRPGDIGYNTMRMWQGVSGLSQLTGLVSPAYTVVVPRAEIMGSFAAHLFKLPEMINRFRRYSQGLVDDTLQLKFRHFSEIEVAIPPPAEQSRIADAIDGLDAELAILARQLDKILEQRSGIIQVLLSGSLDADRSEVRAAG